MYGGFLNTPVPDVDRCHTFVIFGGNPLVSNGSLMTAPGIRKRLEALQARGGRLIVVDPRRSETAAMADEHVFIRPGGDAEDIELLQKSLHVRHPAGDCQSVTQTQLRRKSFQRISLAAFARQNGAELEPRPVQAMERLQVNIKPLDRVETAECTDPHRRPGRERGQGSARIDRDHIRNEKARPGGRRLPELCTD